MSLLDTPVCRVSPFCLGAMTFGSEWGFGSSEQESHAILDRFFELGGNFIDTANVYTKGHSEVILGNYLNRSDVRRDQAVVATKFFGTLYPGDPNAGGANRKSVVAALEASLRRMRTDYVDLLVDALLGQTHTNRRNHECFRRSGQTGQSQIHRL
jgi:aryl-alcohol dehydrogenase-like predicted oxidoreductase